MAEVPAGLAGIAQALTVRLERLHGSLQGLAGQLHDGVAHVVSQAVGDAVRAAVRAVLHDTEDLPPAHDCDNWHPPRPPPRWYSSTETEPRHWWSDDADFDPDEDDHDVAPSTASLSRPPRWRAAMGLACRAALWWLRRQAGRCPWLASLGVGLIATVGAWIGLPAIVGGAGLAGAVVGLVALIETIQSGAHALTP